MAAPRGRGLRPGGVVRALVRLLVLVAVGFGLGLLFGVVTEEPELLAGHLAGESESVSLEDVQSGAGAVDSAASAPLPGVAAAPSVRERPANAPTRAPTAVPTPRPTSLPTPRPTPRPPQTSASPGPAPAAPAVEAVPVAGPVARRAGTGESSAGESGDRWSIQVGAFSDEGAADRLAEGLRARYPVAVLPASGERGRWRVRVQPIRGEARAREMAEALKRDERLPTWVTPMEGRAGR